MKSIESNGGPLVALSREGIAKWGGIENLTFFAGAKSYDNDYEFLCNEEPVEGGIITSKFSGAEGSLISILYPVPTIIVSAGMRYIYLAQIDAIDPGWSPDSLLRSDFEKPIEWRDPFEIALRGGEIVFFDSACVASDLHDDTLSAEVDTGSYQCDWSPQIWEGKADMNFIRIFKHT